MTTPAAPAAPPVTMDSALRVVLEFMAAEVKARQEVSQFTGAEQLLRRGRDSLRDAFEDAIDQAVHICKAMMDRDGGLILPTVSPGRCGLPAVHIENRRVSLLVPCDRFATSADGWTVDMCLTTGGVRLLVGHPPDQATEGACVPFADLAATLYRMLHEAQPAASETLPDPAPASPETPPCGSSSCPSS